MFYLSTLLLVCLIFLLARSGQSIFSRPRPIDINAARRRGLSLDLDLPDDDEEEYSHLRGRNGGNGVLFDAQIRDEEQGLPPPPPPKPSRPAAQNRVDDRDQEDLWAGL